MTPRIAEIVSDARSQWRKKVHCGRDLSKYLDGKNILRAVLMVLTLNISGTLGVDELAGN